MSKLKSPEELRRNLVVALSSARPGHEWLEERPGAGCVRCPGSSLFRQERASHPYVIEEEL